MSKICKEYIEMVMNQKCGSNYPSVQEAVEDLKSCIIGAKDRVSADKEKYKPRPNTNVKTVINVIIDRSSSMKNHKSITDKIFNLVLDRLSEVVNREIFLILTVITQGAPFIAYVGKLADFPKEEFVLPNFCGTTPYIKALATTYNLSTQLQKHALKKGHWITAPVLIGITDSVEEGNNDKSGYSILNEAKGSNDLFIIEFLPEIREGQNLANHKVLIDKLDSEETVRKSILCLKDATSTIATQVAWNGRSDYTPVHKRDVIAYSEFISKDTFAKLNEMLYSL